MLNDNMETQWEQEVENLAWEREFNIDQNNEMFGVRVIKPRYAMVIHMD
jgi:hypothetical protein